MAVPGAGDKEFYFEMLRHDSTKSVWRAELALVFMLQGTGLFQSEDSPTAYLIQQGDIFSINSFQVHSVDLDPEGLAIALYIAPGFISALSPETRPVSVNCKSFLYSQSQQQIFDSLRKQFAQAFQAEYKNESPLPVHLRSRVAVLLANLLRHFSQPVPSAPNPALQDRLKPALEYIHLHYAQPITLAQLAKHSYLSPTYLSRSFQKQLGASFTAYLTQVRLQHATSLLRGEDTITQIAYQCGFTSASALIEAFKQLRGETPGQFRRKLQESPPAAGSPASPEGFSTVFTSLMQFIEAEEDQQAPPPKIDKIKGDWNAPAQPLVHSWRAMVNAGYARDLLNGSVQQQIALLQETVGFRHIRCKGLLDDDMMFYTQDAKDQPVYNFNYIFDLIDFILSIGAYPMLDFSHMPSALAKNRRTMFRRPAVLSPPKDFQKWKAALEILLAKLVERYGLDCMKNWWFSPWMAPEYIGMGFYTAEEYLATYTISHRAIKKTCPQFTICGPGCSIHTLQSLEWFIGVAKEKDCMPDIFGLYSFQEEPPGQAGGLELIEKSNEAFYFAVSGDEGYLSHSLEKAQTLLQQQGLGHIPIMLTEWSNNIWQRDLCNDTSYKSAYIFKSILENYDQFAALGYFSAVDQMDEIAPPDEIFHGGFGLFAKGGLPKSALGAMQLLRFAGDRLLCRGEGYFVSASAGQIQIFLYNYCHYDLLYRYRHTTKLTQTQRYKVFNEKPSRSFHIHLDNVPPGPYSIQRYSIGPQGGSIFDAWLEMGAPTRLTKEEHLMLVAKSHPVYKRETAVFSPSAALHAQLLPHEVQCIVLTHLP